MNVYVKNFVVSFMVAFIVTFTVIMVVAAPTVWQGSIIAITGVVSTVWTIAENI